jgi:exosortase/archaeosortase family protein
MGSSQKRKDKAKGASLPAGQQGAGRPPGSPPPRPKTWLETHGRDLRFLVLFVLFMGIYWVISTTSTVADRFIPWYLDANAGATVSVLSAVGYPDISRNGSSVSCPKGSVTVARGCDAMDPAALFISAVLASPVPWSARLLAAVAGTALLLAINLFRIISLFLCAVHWKSAFDVMHLDVWQGAFIFLAIFLWAGWASWIAKRNLRQAHAAT